jgi:hypothetical protein
LKDRSLPRDRRQCTCDYRPSGQGSSWRFEVCAVPTHVFAEANESETPNETGLRLAVRRTWSLRVGHEDVELGIGERDSTLTRGDPDSLRPVAQKSTLSNQVRTFTLGRGCSHTQELLLMTSSRMARPR